MKSFTARLYGLLLAGAHVLCTLLLCLRDLVLGLLRHAPVFRRDGRHDAMPAFAKLPRHLALLIGHEQPSYRDLANVVVWCAAAGIPFVTFYDHNGVLKRNEHQLREAVDKCNESHRARLDGHTNGSSSRVKLRVSSLTDGRQKIVELTRQLAEQATTSSDIDIDFVDRRLRQDGMPDPDLALYCGQTCSTFGFPPWQVRITEFVNVRTHHDFTIQTFLSLLHSYETCEQRHGK